jgi:hypothetical protein
MQFVKLRLDARVRVTVRVMRSSLRITSTSPYYGKPVHYGIGYLDTMPVTRARVKVRVLTEARKIRTTSRARVVARGCSRKEATTYAIFFTYHIHKNWHESRCNITWY